MPTRTKTRKRSSPASLTLDVGPAVIRDFRPEDAEALAANANDREIWRNLRDHLPHPYTIQDARDFLSGTTPWHAFAIDVGGELAGGMGYMPGEDVYRRRVEIGYWLGRRYWNRGIATAAVRGLCDWLFEHDPDLLRIQAEVYAWNQASMRVLAKAGFLFEGRLRKAVFKDDQVVDSLMFARTR